MKLKLLFSNWTKVAGLLLILGALAWTFKLGVIISTNGRIIDTGAAAFLMKVGLVMLLVGSTGLGNYLGQKSSLLIRIIAILISPAIVVGLIFLFGLIFNPLFGNIGVWYAEEEAPIATAVIVSFPLGFFLYKSYKPIIY